MSSLKTSVELVTINRNKVSSRSRNLESQSGKEGKKNKKLRTVLEIACVTLAIVVILGLSSPPIVFFYLPAVNLLIVRFVYQCYS